MSRSSSSRDSNQPQDSTISPWLWAQLATAFLFGALVALLITTPRREAAVRSLPQREPLANVPGSEQRNISQGSSRQVKPVELHRSTAAATSESPRAVELRPQAVVETPPPVNVALDQENDSRPNWTDLVVHGPVKAPLTTAPATSATTTVEGASENKNESPEIAPSQDSGPTLDAPAETKNEANDGREAQAGEHVEKAPADHKDPSALDMSEVGKRNAAQAEPMQTETRREPTAAQMALHSKLKACVDYYYREPVTVEDYGPWGIMHALIPFGVDTNVYANGQQVNAIGWICFNGRCHGQRLFRLTPEGKIDPLIGVGVQGHPGQFLSMLAQSRVRTDYPLRIEGREFTVADLIEREQETCKVKTELTFKLIAMSHYLDTDTTWKSETGEDWDIPKLIREELAAPIVGAACGGTHRMTGFSYAVNKRMKEGKPMEGQWERARKYLEDFKAYTYRLQNSDGSFSSNWFAGRGDWGGPVRKLETTGHISEWLISACSDEELADPRLIRALSLLSDTLIQGRGTKWEIGPRGHGIHALVMYDERVYGAKPGERRLNLASRLPVPAPTEEPKKQTNPSLNNSQMNDSPSPWSFRRR